MSNRATATFNVDTWDEQPYDEREGARLSRVRLTKTFRGDLEGVSSADLLMVGGQVETSRAYVGVERIDGRLHGRSGTFVLLHTAVGSRDRNSTAWTIVPDTGTGELQGLSGTATITIEADGTHHLALDYELSAETSTPGTRSR